MNSLKKVMVTGASGFLGRAIIEKTYKSYEVYAVVSGRHPVHFPEAVHIIETDLLDMKNCEQIMKVVRPEVFLHYAWDVQESDFEVSVNNIIWLEVSLCLLRYFVANGGKRVIFAGTGSEYGISNGKWKEQDAIASASMSLYGESKRAFAIIMKNYCFAHHVEYVDVRYFSVYGEGDNRRYAVITKTILSLRNSELVVCKYPDNIWDYIYIQDAVDATIKLIESNYCGTVNICSGIPHRMGDVFGIIARELGKESLISFEYNNGCQRIFVGDTSIMEQELGYKCKTSFEVGVKKVISPPPPIT
jgi:nucleoside-diphosphate-sugar epimerase